jgi:hypothetical protein
MISASLHHPPGMWRWSRHTRHMLKFPWTYVSKRLATTSYIHQTKLRNHFGWQRTPSKFYILLTVHHVMILGKWPTWRKFTSDLHTTRPPTQSDSYQRLCWHNFSPDDEHDVLETCGVTNKNKNKYIVKNCASLWSFTKNTVYLELKVRLLDQNLGTASQ